MSISKTKVAIIAACAVIALLLGIIGVLGWKYSQANKNTESETKKTSAQVLGQVGQLYELPTDEEPTIAVIEDKSKLQNQEFFKKAQNGDYLLVYQKNKIAFVYRKAINKLIIVAPVSIDSQASQDNI